MERESPIKRQKYRGEGLEKRVENESGDNWKSIKMRKKPQKIFKKWL